MQWGSRVPYEWHKWFAWRPVRFDGTQRYAWMEYVECRRQCGIYLYREARK